MSAVLTLLWPRGLGLLNRWRRASAAERSTIGVFVVFGVAFWAAMFGGVGCLVYTFH